MTSERKEELRQHFQGAPIVVVAESPKRNKAQVIVGGYRTVHVALDKHKPMFVTGVGMGDNPEKPQGCYVQPRF